MQEGNEPQAGVPPVTIHVRNNGPLLVDGPFRLVDADGAEHPVPAGKQVKLCRCGASTRKPFCDGAHSRIGFAAAERAVREMGGGAPQGGAPAA
jgi:CDGSH-type Zn-finger protein